METGRIQEEYLALAKGRKRFLGERWGCRTSCLFALTTREMPVAKVVTLLIKVC